MSAWTFQLSMAFFFQKKEMNIFCISIWGMRVLTFPDGFPEALLGVGQRLLVLDHLRDAKLLPQKRDANQARLANRDLETAK